MDTGITKAVILAGGRGTRLRPLTNYLPKPLIPVLNRPFLEYIIAYLHKNSIDDIVLATGYLPEVVEHYLGDGSGLGVRLSYSVEKEPLGTAGAVKNAEKYLSGTFVVLNGDTFTDFNIAEMLAFHHDRKSRATIALTRVDNASAFGVVSTDGDGKIRGFTEKPASGQITACWINAGIYLLEPDILRLVPPDRYCMFENETFPLLLQLNKAVCGYPFNGYLMDIGTPEKYLQLNIDLLQSKTKSAFIAEQLGRSGILCGKDVFMHDTAKITGPVVIADGCDIGKEVCIKGSVVIGRNCHISEGAIIEESVLWNNVTVGANVNLKRCVVTDDTLIESNRRISNSVITKSDGEVRL